MKILLFLLILATFAVSATPAAGQSLEDQPIGGGAESAPAAAAQPATGPSVTRVAGSLALVAALIVALGWAYRKLSVGTESAKSGPVTLIGRSMLTPKHQVLVLKVGYRLVVIGDSGQGMQPLCEITDPAEMTTVLSAAGKDEAELQALRGGAFTASLQSAESDYEPLPDSDSEPQDSLTDLGAASEEVRSLIERVRGLSDSQHSASSA